MIDKKVFACLTREDLKFAIAILTGLTAGTLTLSLILIAAGQMNFYKFAEGAVIGSSSTAGLVGLGVLSRKFGLFSSEDCLETSNLIKDSLIIQDYKSLN